MTNLTNAPSINSILITGGSGFLAFHLTVRLLTKYPSAQIHLVDIRPPHQSFHSNPRVVFHSASIVSLSAMTSIFLSTKPELVFHTAGLVPSTARRLGINTFENFKDINVTGTRNALSASHSSGTVRAFVHTSSIAAVSQPWRNMRGVSEASCPGYPAKPFGYYHGTKAEGERIALEQSGPEKEGSIPACALRVAVLFGEHDTNLVPLFYDISQSKLMRRVRLGDETNMFDFLDVDSAAHAHVLAAEGLLERPEEVGGEAFYISNCEPVRFGDFVGSFKARFGYVSEPDVWKITIPVMLLWFILKILEFLAPLWGGQLDCVPEETVEGTLDRYFDGSKAEKLLGYRPVSDLSDGIERACTAYMKSIGKG